MTWRVGLLTVVLTLCAAAGAQADTPKITIGPDGTTSAVFDYDQAVRQRVFIPQPGIDQDSDGKPDTVAIEIIRPKESGPSMKVPAIIDPSPYFSTVCRGNEGQCIGDTDKDGLNDKWPLFYDNFFVPRGYAYVLAEANGTANSTGCPLHGGPGDVQGEKSVIDWLNGRVPGYDKSGKAVLADWHNGSSAMIGKSYDGTLANGVAATGVEGLKTIVPISAISSWYKYSRQGGIDYYTDYPAGLSEAITNPDRETICKPSRDAMSAADGDETGDLNPFWNARDYLANVGRVKAAVFESHGLQDDNVKADHFGAWWAGLAANGVPRKLWLSREGHVDPFEYRRAAWVDTLHRWFDHWLLGVDNKITDQPRVDIEDAKDTWHSYSDWPVPGSADTPVYLQGVKATSAGALGLSSGGATSSLAFKDSPTQTEDQMLASPTGSQQAKRVFLSPPLKKALRVSGTPQVDVTAATSTTQSNVGVVLVDYGTGTHVTRTGDGVQNTTTRTCWGQSPSNGVDYSACYLEVTKPTETVASWRVTRGILDTSNRNSLSSATPMSPGVKARLRWPLVPQDYEFAAGHQIGVVLVGDYPDYDSIPGTPNATITLDTKASKVTLPIVGGYPAAVASGAFAKDTVAPAIAVPADITVGATSSSGAQVLYGAPGVADNEDPAPSASCAPPSGATFPIGTTTVTCTARDASANTSRKSFRVTVTAKAPANPTPPSTTPTPAPAPPAAAPAATTTPAAPAAGATPAPAASPSPTLDTKVDRTAPTLGRVVIGRIARGLRVSLKLSEHATVRVSIRRRGAARALKVVTAKLGSAGRRSVSLRGIRLRPGRYVVTVRATDAKGNARTLTRVLVAR